MISIWMIRFMAVTVIISTSSAGFQLVGLKLRNPMIMEGLRAPPIMIPIPYIKPRRIDTKQSDDSMPSYLIRCSNMK